MKLNDSEINKLSSLMKQQRQEKGYTLEQTRLKLEKNGLSVARSDIQRIEDGDRKIPNPILINALCKLYNIDTVKVFQKIGYLDKKENLELSSEMNNMKKIKIYSSIAAGFGNFSNEVKETEDEIYLPLKIEKDIKDLCAIRVKVDDMIPEIKNGSLIIVKKNTEILNNEIGAFFLNGDWFIKRKKVTERDDLMLVSENRECVPILIRESDDYKELGKVIGVYSTF
ncbi:phage repressor protein [Fusobacterium necrophorum BFTR-2]|nr:S24 family peptidase [Fusobacterium necrophorum]KDE74772.1 phage repressor protein [Fusobacterium necrophorum BFTR-2]MDY2573576.1 S24 family peptidase [Fusobacterium necrophorum]